MAQDPDLQHPAWVLDEVAFAGRENLDADHVGAYDVKEDARAPEEVELLVEHGLDEAATLVDLGAGTGQLTLAAAAVCARVVAVDISPVMLGRLRAKVRAAGPRNIEVVEAGFLTYEHQGVPADVVYSRWALHHLPDFWKAIALTRMRAMLRTGGLLRLSDIACSFEPSEAPERIERWRQSLPVESADEDAWVRADIDDHVRDEHSTFTWLLEPMIERSGFRIDRAVHSDDGWFADYLARAV